MKPTMNMTKIKISVSKGFSAVTPWRAGQVLALGALPAAGTVLSFNMVPGSQAGSPSSIEKMEVAPKFTDLDAVDNYLSVDDLRNYVYPEEPDQARADNPSSNENPKITHLESQIASLLADAAREPSRNTPQLNREIERLDYQIDMLRLNAMRDPSVGKSSSQEQGKAVRPLWNLRAIERLYAQIDRMLAAEAQDRSGYSPSSSEQIGTWPPDTEYYLYPDYSERQTGR
jgi:hypothetical protein